jgi:tRNA modification GTPase
MFSTTDTIVAIATPLGRGGIGVVRLSGSDACRVAAELGDEPLLLEPRRATLTRVRGAGGILDRAVVTFFPTPHSYTGEDVVEISAHGSPVLLRALVEAAVGAGARLAEPGEFTLRAYLAGRIDLVQAEAVHDLVNAVTPLQARVAFDQLEGTLTGRIREIHSTLFDLSARFEASLDFPEEGYHFVAPDGAAGEIERVVGQLEDLLADAGRGRLVREGAQVAIVGRPNSGKSSLFNRLAGAGRAIVTAIPGTTRDLVTEVVDIDGLAVTLVDTAGLRDAPSDAVEIEGISRTRGAAAVAGLVLVVLDRSQPLGPDDRDALDMPAAGRLIVANKSDLPAAWAADAVEGAVPVSALTGDGMTDLRHRVTHALAATATERDAPAITNVRHVDLLRQARTSLERAAAAAAGRVPEELVAADLGEARRAIEEVTGARTADDVLTAIFTKFCIGK